MIKKMICLLSPGERKQAFGLLLLVLMVAILDTLGVASILPFITVLSNPELIETNHFLNSAYKASNYFGVQTIDQFNFVLGCIVFFVLIITAVLRAISSYWQASFALMREYSIGKRIVEACFHQPYSWFLDRNSAELSKTILSEVGTVVNGGFKPLLNLCAQAFVVVALITLLLIVNAAVALSVGVALGLTYSIIFFSVSRLLTRLGKTRFRANEERFASVLEAFGAVKDVKLGGFEKVYSERFAVPAKRYAGYQSAAQAIAQMPRYLMEVVAFGGLLLMTLYLMAESGDLAAVMPTIAVFAFAGYRLLPATQQIYNAVTQLRFVGPALNVLCRDFATLKTDDSGYNSSGKMIFKNMIRLREVSYRYPMAVKSAIEMVDLTIPVGCSLGIVGVTGGGKTTLVDLVIGLLEPQEGSILIDDHPLSGANRRQWQQSIGYVPQHIFLTDDSVAANIAFGVNNSEIDYQAVVTAAKAVQLHDFVITDLPRGYHTAVGERGVRLSGGQRQRIGIARALYRDPSVLVLDEATSALDNITEKAVMDAIRSLDNDLTLIMIAHRLDTVKHCDQICLVENGKVTTWGNFDDLLSSCERFKIMAASE